MNRPTDKIESFLLTNRESVLGFIRSKVGDDALAEDILQDSLLKAIISAPDIHDDDKLVSWFYRIIRNAIIDAYRRQAAAARRLEKYALDQDDSELPPEDEAILCSCIKDLLPSLKPEYALLIETMDLGAMAPEDMAKRLDITRNNLKVRHHRARLQLRERLEQTCRLCAEHGCLDCTCKR